MIRRFAPLATALLLAVSLGATGCREDPAGAWRGMNVIWISFDSVRADHCSFEGYARNTTPQLDAVARHGVRFSRCIAQAPYTLPSYASMLTSRYVAELAVQEQRDEKDKARILGIAPGPSESDALISEVLRGAGYRTAAFVQSWVSKPLGFDQGWDVFRHRQETLKEKIPELLRFVEENRDRKFFAFLYTTDTHYPFLHAHERKYLYGKYASEFDFTLDAIHAVREGRLRPSAEDMANAMALYDEGLHWADADLSPLLELLERTGLKERTIIVFNADHGEEFDEHGVISHGQTYYDAVVRTPLVIAAPGTPAAGTAVTELVQNIDIAPTLVEMVGVERPAGWSGRSLAWALAGKPSPAGSPPPAFSEGAWTFWIGSVLQGDRKFILVTPKERMLFDLAADPGETRNLAMEESGRDSVRTLYHVLMKHLGGPSGRVTSAGQAPSYETWIQQVMGHYGLSEESDVVKELRSLGYLK